MGSDGSQVVLRHAVSSNAGSAGLEYGTDTAYADSRLLVVAHGIQHLSSPGSPSVIAAEALRRLDTPTDAAHLAATLEGGINDIRETFKGLLAGNPGWNETGVVLTAMLWHGTRAAIAHIGSTRAYMLRDGELIQLTCDHTMGQLLLDSGAIKPEELGTDPRHSSVINRWLNGNSEDRADITTHEGAVGDRYLLCTGGFDRVLSPSALRRMLLETMGNPREAANAIVGAIPAAKEHCIFTCVTADIVEQAPRAGACL